jgi:hypothetical protein
VLHAVDLPARRPPSWKYNLAERVGSELAQPAVWHPGHHHARKGVYRPSSVFTDMRKPRPLREQEAGVAEL